MKMCKSERIIRVIGYASVLVLIALLFAIVSSLGTAQDDTSMWSSVSPRGFSYIFVLCFGLAVLATFGAVFIPPMKMNEINSNEKACGQSRALKIAGIALLVPWVLGLCLPLVIDSYSSVMLGLFAVVPAAVVALAYTSRRQLGISASTSYPFICVVFRIIALLYFVPFIISLAFSGGRD
jgi:hypothetical protein